MSMFKLNNIEYGQSDIPSVEVRSPIGHHDNAEWNGQADAFEIITPPETNHPVDENVEISDHVQSKIDPDIRIKPKELQLITSQLASLLQAGMPLVPALTALQEQFEGQPALPVITRIVEQVKGGLTLADTLDEFPQFFSRFYISMVRAGEATGTLEDVLERLADMLEKRAQITSKVKVALAYPILMSIVAVGVVMFLMAVVIPNISEIFMDMDKALPWPTTLLITISLFIKSNFLALIIAIAVFVMAIRSGLKTPGARRLWHYYKLKLPMLGNLFIKVEAGRLARTLGIMLSSGIPILNALTIVKGVIQNQCVADSLQGVQEDIQKGYSVANAIRQTGLFPPVMHHTIAIGEMSGNLEQQLINIADRCDDELNNITQSLTALIEPVILLVMGSVIGFIVLALLLPIFEINQML